MIEVRQTAVFRSWLSTLADREAVRRIAQRIARVRNGLFGDVKPVGEGVSELRVDYGPGYRIYLVRRGQQVVVLLCGGDKRSQSRDIRTAIAMAAELKGPGQ
jgi:putative addiction module killer protein